MSGNLKLKNLSKRVDCDLCQKSFFGIGELKRHRESVHEKMKKSKCKICQKSFRRNYDLKRHTDEVHLKLKSVK